MAATKAIRDTMDDKVLPCDNFYQFACGGWMRSNPIPATKSLWDKVAVLSKQNQVVIKKVLGERRHTDMTTRLLLKLML